MYGDSERDLIMSLNSMCNVALARNYHDRVAARSDLEQSIKNDRRFDRFNASVLATQYEQARNCGAALRLDDPRLRAEGGQARPLSLDTHW